ncbi:EscU/YscU/HrcU family type III secretion system export apparatus switch protein [Derxia lacustris]|uniref:EscU/YscU/HrcU family type III secretion system export apparatus switch protein n=1 Tax=Derxia lacustris TaxID=764842 RepID=UPI000A16FB32|nr:flagellar type III secretion system protein FlhB [Derxia lacustris]
MADSDKEDRTLPASQKRIADAREEGQLPRSRELATIGIVGGSISTLLFTAGDLSKGMQEVLRHGLSFDRRAVDDTGQMALRFGQLGIEALWVFAPMMAVAFVGAIVGMLALGGWNFTTKPLGVKLERLDPLGGLSRMLSMHTLAEIGKGMVAVLLLGAVALSYSSGSFAELPALAASDVRSALAAGADRIGTALLLLVFPLVGIGAVDGAIAWWKHSRDMRMSPQELKQEMKEAEGNQEVKGKIRAQQRALARRRMMAAVPNADVIVTNPTHYAVALAYKDGDLGAPKVVAKGVDITAARIREIAEAAGVMIVEAPPLARALYANTELEAEIPGALFSAVAQVLAYVYRIRRGMAAGELGEVPVPPGLDPAEKAAPAAA